MSTPADRRGTQVNLRLQAGMVAELARRASSRQIAPATLAARYVREGIIMDRHPRIRFIDRAGGREAMLVGTRLSAIDVIRTVRQNGDSIEEAADYLQVSPADVADVVGYYVDWKDDLDAAIDERDRAEEDELARWRRTRHAFAR